jgi:hypothetical protein
LVVVLVVVGLANVVLGLTGAGEEVVVGCDTVGAAGEAAGRSVEQATSNKAPMRMLDRDRNMGT